VTRTRIIAILALLATAVLAAPADATSARGAQQAARPIVGQCRTTTYAQASGSTDPRMPVPCSRVHRLKTYAVVTVPMKYNLYKPNGPAFSHYAYVVCTRKFWSALGGNSATRSQTSYEEAYFLPTKAQLKTGARWLRCDVSLYGAVPGSYSYVQPLPNLQFPLIGTRPITDATRRCLANAGNDYVTTCNRPHVARADQTFTINSTAVPSHAAINAQASTTCPGKRIVYPYPLQWELGNHTITCFTKTTT
jgi:hypothetical protein